MRIEFHDLRGCPHASAALVLLERCLAHLDLHVPIHQLEGDHPSPSILVDGHDVMGDPPTRERSCRLDVPTELNVIAALQAATKRGTDVEP